MSRLAVSAALLVFALSWGGGTVPAAQNGSAPAPTTPRPPAEIPLARLTPDAVIAVTLTAGAAASDDAIWTIEPGAGRAIRIGAKDNKPAAPAAIGPGPCASLAIAFGSVWVPLCESQKIARLDLKTLAVTASVTIPVAAPHGRIATSVGSVWAITDRRGVVTRIDPDTNAPIAEIYVAAAPVAVAAGDNALWVTSEDGNRLTRVNPHTNEIVETIGVGPKPGRVAIGEGGVWTLNRGDGSVTRVDIVRIDPRTNRAVQHFTGEGGGAILVAHGSLWVAAAPNVTWRLDPALVAGVRP
jgi:virginiamycin B lyase